MTTINEIHKTQYVTATRRFILCRVSYVKSFSVCLKDGVAFSSCSKLTWHQGPDIVAHVLHFVKMSTNMEEKLVMRFK